MALIVSIQYCNCQLCTIFLPPVSTSGLIVDLWWNFCVSQNESVI